MTKYSVQNTTTESDLQQSSQSLESLQELSTKIRPETDWTTQSKLHNSISISSTNNRPLDISPDLLPALPQH